MRSTGRLTSEKIADLLRLAVLEDLEVALRERRDELALRVDDARVHFDVVDFGLEGDAGLGRDPAAAAVAPAADRRERRHAREQGHDRESKDVVLHKVTGILTGSPHYKTSLMSGGSSPGSGGGSRTSGVANRLRHLEKTLRCTSDVEEVERAAGSLVY